MFKRLACDRLQINLFNEITHKHRWEDGRCVYCKKTQQELVVKMCDCGCRTVIEKTHETLTIKDKHFIYGHETIDMFESIHF
jgi:hypothetical protein